jgi:hypothetical protein
MRGRSRHFSTLVAAGIGLIGGAGIGGLYLGLSARASLPAEPASAIAVQMSASDTVNLRFPADWSEPSEAAPRMLAFASADGDLTLFSPRPIYPIEDTSAPAAPPETAAKTEPPAAAQTARAAPAPAPAKMALASASSRPAPKPRSNAVLNDSQIASIKRRLSLTPDQERYWPAVEAELRKMEYKKGQGTRTASVDMSKVDVEGLKSAGFPLVMSFSDDQRRELKSLAHLLGLENVMSGI